MAMISIDNFIAPFRKPVHLVTIFLITATVGVWRASGGKVEVVDQNRQTSVKERIEEQKKIRTRNPAPKAKKKFIKKKKNPKLDSLLKRDGIHSTKNKKSNKKKNNPLDDIERSLGLR